MENEPKYPIVGTWELINGVLILNQKPDEEFIHIYANEWVLAESNGKVGLINPDIVKVLMWHKSAPTSRMLYKSTNKIEMQRQLEQLNELNE